MTAPAAAPAAPPASSPPAAPPPPPPDEGASDSPLLDALVGPRLSRRGVRVHRLKSDGSRGAMLLTVAHEDDPAEVRARIARYGAGEYELAPVLDNRYHGQTSRMVIEASEVPSEPAQAPAAAPAAPDLAGLMRQVSDMMAAQQREMAQQMRELMQAQQLAAANQNAEMFKLLAARPQGPAESLLPQELLVGLIKRAFDPPPPQPDPFEQIAKMLKVQKLLSNGGTEENSLTELVKGVAPVVAGAFAAAQQGAQQQPRRTVAAVRPAPPAPAAAAGEPAAPPPAEDRNAEFAQLLTVIEGMARRQVAPDAALVALSALLSEEDMEQVASLVTIPGALDQLEVIAPGLKPYRAWLEALAAELSDPDNPEAPSHDPDPAP